MAYQFKNSWEIEGLDEPLIAPWIIPKGYQQEWDSYNFRYRLIPKISWRKNRD